MPSDQEQDYVEPPTGDGAARQETVYLSFEAPSVDANDAKVSKSDEGPLLEDMEPAATISEDNKPLEEVGPTHEEGAHPTCGDSSPDHSSSLLDE